MTDKTKDSILVIDTSSSSVKLQVFSKHPSSKLLVQGSLSDLGKSPLFTAKYKRQATKENSPEEKELPADYSHEKALHFILRWIEAQSQSWQVDTVTHRIVHGGVHDGDAYDVSS